MFLDVVASSISVREPWVRSASPSLHELKKYPVALIGDVMGRIGMMTSVIRPQTRLTDIAGHVLPVLTREGDNLAIHRALDEAEPGDVLVIDAHAEENRAVFGDLLGDICIAKGVAGVIIDGATRDVRDLDELGLPVHARAVNPAGPAKVGPGRVGFPVAVGNVVCNPGDIVIADADGVIVFPAVDLDAILERVVKQDAFECELRSRIRASAI